MKENRVLAFDFGASSGRCILGVLDTENKKIHMEEIHRFSNDFVKVSDTIYWDTLRQFFEIKQGLIKANEISEYASIGIDTWGVDFAFLDKQGKLLESSIHYRDNRTVGMVDEVLNIIPKLYEHTGNQIENFNTIFQLYSLTKNRKDFLDRADVLLLTPDLFNYFLTGNKKAEYTIATTTQLMDSKKREWSKEVCNNLGISCDIFPEIIKSGTVVGNISTELVEELGISETKVIAVSSHDTQSAVVAVPVTEPKEDFVFISCGTWSLIGTELKTPLINEKTLNYNISNEGGFGETSTLLKNVTGLWLIQESRRQWEKEGMKFSFGELERMAKEIEPLKCFINPDAEEFIAPGNIPKRIQEFCKRTNQEVPKTIGEIVCCINQSLAMKYRYILEQIEDCTGKKYSNIYMIGGGIQSKMLCEMTALSNNKKVVAGPIEATALGNIAVQFIALGLIKDLNEARCIISNSEETYEYYPKENINWEEAYYKFKKLILV